MVDPNALDEHLGRLSEERARFARVLPSFGVVPSIALNGAEDDEVTVSTALLRLLLEVDGRRSVLGLAYERGLVAAARSVSRRVELGLVTVRAIQPIEAGGITTPTPRPATMSNNRPLPWRGRAMAGDTRETDNGVDRRTRPFDGRGPGRA